MGKKSKIRNQIIIGAAGFLASIGTFIFYVNTFNFANQWFDLIFLTIISGFFLGSLLYMFGGLSMFFYGLMMGAGMVIFMILAKKLPGIWAGVFMVVCTAIFVAWPKVKDYLVDREKNSDEPKIKKLAQRLKEEEELMEKEAEANEEILSSIGYGEKSLLLVTRGGWAYYQCINCEDKLYFAYVGSGMNGIEEGLLKKDFSDENDFITDKRDFSVNKSDILCIKYKANRMAPAYLGDSGFITLICRGMKKRFTLNGASLETFRKFFYGINMEVKSKKKTEKKVESFMESAVKIPQDKDLIAKLKLTTTILTVTSVLVSAMFLFLPVYYRAMSITCMLLFIVIFALYVKFNDIISLSDKSGEADFTKEKVRVTFAIMAPGMGLALRSIFDFTFADFKMFWIWTIALAVLILSVFFKYTEEYKRDKSAILIIVLTILFYAPSTIAQINSIFDYSKSKLTQSTVLSMRITEDSKSGKTYKIEASVSNGKVLKFRISEEYYKKLAVGDKITIYEKPGFLKITHVGVRER